MWALGPEIFALAQEPLGLHCHMVNTLARRVTLLLAIQQASPTVLAGHRPGPGKTSLAGDLGTTLHDHQRTSLTI